jgi:hypothetical protein
VVTVADMARRLLRHSRVFAFAQLLDVTDPGSTGDIIQLGPASMG